MQKIITSEKIPIKLWLDDIEDGTLQQAINLANLPFAYKWIALMPDAHQGYGMPIGGVLATTDFIVPNAVGVDIGCGMCATKTSLKSIETDSLKILMRKIRERIPIGFNHHKEKMQWNGFDKAPDIPIIQNELNAAHYQLGTLGSGNHFIEIQKTPDDFIWIMIHSGSRNFGLQIATEYNKIAKKHCIDNYPDFVKKDIAFLDINKKDAQDYIVAMNYALDFAKENRFRMIEAIKNAFLEIFPNINFEETINIHHNYAAIEKHYGKEVIVHRKGATSAKEKQIGIIPGSQGTKSYIVEGKGNPESFTSCSHGAGRKLGRKQAQRQLNLEDEKKKLDELGIIHSIRNVSDLDEASGAYKDINVVMHNQKDLVNILFELSPLAVIKS